MHTKDMQVLCGRTVTQLGLCAFRLGMIQQCKEILSDITDKNRLKTLLGQTQNEKSVEGNEIQEKLKLLPMHMHLNKDLVDFCYLTSSMLLEVVNISKSNSNEVISKQFRSLLANFEKNLFSFPPENHKDQIMASFRAILDGDWENGIEFLLTN